MFQSASRFSCRRLLAVFGIVASAVSMAPAPARAGDGVIEINQTCATQTGCFAGDAAGFPVTTSEDAGRSYRLTSDLVVTTASQTAISTDDDDLTIDLNGFALIGPNTCSGSPTSCALSGAGDGISGLGNRIRITNGHIRGFGADGIDVNQGQVSGIHASNNGGDGIDVGGRGIVTGCTVESNAGNGLITNQASVMEGNVSYANGGDGIQANGVGSVLRGNTARANAGDGIQTTINSLAVNNVVYINTGFGLRLSSGTGYSENSVNSNTGGTVSSGIAIGTNLCNGNTTCP